MKKILLPLICVFSLLSCGPTAEDACECLKRANNEFIKEGVAGDLELACADFKGKFDGDPAAIAKLASCGKEAFNSLSKKKFMEIPGEETPKYPTHEFNTLEDFNKEYYEDGGEYKYNYTTIVIKEPEYITITNNAREEKDTLKKFRVCQKGEKYDSYFWAGPSVINPLEIIQPYQRMEGQDLGSYISWKETYSSWYGESSDDGDNGIMCLVDLQSGNIYKRYEVVNALSSRIYGDKKGEGVSIFNSFDWINWVMYKFDSSVLSQGKENNASWAIQCGIKGSYLSGDPCDEIINRFKLAFEYNYADDKYLKKFVSDAADGRFWFKVSKDLKNDVMAGFNTVTPHNKAVIKFEVRNDKFYLLQVSDLKTIDENKLVGQKVTLMDNVTSSESDTSNDTKTSEDKLEKTKKNISTAAITYFKINDPDGYSNLRDAPKGKVMQKVMDSERFEVVGDESGYKKVKLKDGTEGYIHSSRVIQVN